MVHVVEIQDINSSSVLHLNDDLKSDADNFNFNESAKKPVNFGSGVELLMNDKRKSDSNPSKNNYNIELEDLKTAACFCIIFCIELLISPTDVSPAECRILSNRATILSVTLGDNGE